MDEKQWFEPNYTSRNHFTFIMIVSMVATEENIITQKISQLDTFLIFKSPFKKCFRLSPVSAVPTIIRSKFQPSIRTLLSQPARAGLCWSAARLPVHGRPPRRTAWLPAGPMGLSPPSGAGWCKSWKAPASGCEQKHGVYGWYMVVLGGLWVSELEQVFLYHAFSAGSS